MLEGLEWYSAGRTHRGDLRLAGGRIVETGAALQVRAGERVVDLHGHVAFPGLVNAHDHLDLDLLPHLGTPPYASFVDWAQDVYRPDDAPVRDLLRVSRRDRLLWGGYRNLIAGTTAVMHHDRYERAVFHGGYPVRVVERYRWAHSLAYGGDIRGAFARGDGPFVIHAAEGTDARAAAEIEQLDALGVLVPGTVLVHAVAVDAGDWTRLAARGVGLVWCPGSSLRLYGATAAVDAIPEQVPIALGTDSTISGSADLLQELRAAHATGLVGIDRLAEMVTTVPARMFGLPPGTGEIRKGGPADLLVVVADADGAGAERLLTIAAGTIELVIRGGQIVVAAPQLIGRPANARIDGQERWLTGNLVGLRRRIVQAGGEAAWEGNPVWSRLVEVGA